MRIWLRIYYTGTKKLFLKYCFERTERWRYGSEEHGNWLFMLTVFPKKTKLRLWLKLLQRGRRRSHNCWCIQTRSTFPMRIRFQEAKIGTKDFLKIIPVLCKQPLKTYKKYTFCHVNFVLFFLSFRQILYSLDPDLHYTVCGLWIPITVFWNVNLKNVCSFAFIKRLFF